MTSITSSLFAYSSSNVSNTQALFESFSGQNSGSASTASASTAADQVSLSGTALGILLGTDQEGSDASGDAMSGSCYGSAGASQGTSGYEALIGLFSSTPTSSDTATSSVSGTSDGTGTAISADGGLSQLFSLLQQLVTDVESDLENVGSGTAAAQASTAANTTQAMDADSSYGSTAFAENALANGGPLPAFLAQTDAQMNLNPTQQQALQNIAAENMNASDTPQTVQTIAQELQQANI